MKRQGMLSGKRKLAAVGLMIVAPLMLTGCSRLETILLDTLDSTINALTDEFIVQPINNWVNGKIDDFLDPILNRG